MASKKPSEQVKVGIIGAGIGQSHIRGYKQSPQAQIVALCDMNEERARQVAHEQNIEPQIYGDYREMIDKAGLDAVSIGLPNYLHAPVTIECLQAGLHVLCEKPLAMNSKEAQKIADAAAKHNRKCMVGQVSRFRADSLFFKKLIEAGELGHIYYAHAVSLRKKGIPGYGGWFTNKAQSGGGPLIDIGVHLLDIAWWLAGCPQPIAVSGATYAEFGPHGQGIGSGGAHDPKGIFDVEDLAVGLIRFANGLTINLEVSWALHTKTPHMGAHLYGTLGGLDWGPQPALFQDINGIETVTTPDLPRLDNWAGQTAHFIHCILHDKTPDPDATQGVTMMKMLEALYKSAATNKEVTIK
ncbi:MAG TPA: Gfo/Idh/MocA family oxidoreductase [Abditibacteriaceae bacterium]|jgi:predicted dehydrogenase